MTNSYKQLFERMKEMGYFQNYESYEAYKEAREINHEPYEPLKDVESWKKTLSEEDLKRYNKMFK